MAVRNQDTIEPNLLVLPQVVSEVRDELLITLREISWVYESLERAPPNHEAVGATEGECTRILDVKLDRKVCQSLPSFSRLL